MTIGKDSNRLYHYRGYGLRIDSPIQLPWPTESSRSKSDLSICHVEVPVTLDSATDTRGYFQVSNGICLLNVEGFARCLISEKGTKAQFDTRGSYKYPIICILDSVLAVCLHLRGILALNASAIATKEGAVVFAGPTGIGKSTVVAALCDLGYPLVADGIVAVSQNNDLQPQVLCGFPQILLWKKSIDALQGSWNDHARWQIRPELQGFLVSAPHFHGLNIPVHSVYLLGKHTSSIEREPLASAKAMARLIHLTCRANLLRGLGQDSVHFHNVAAVIQHSSVECLLLPVVNCPPAKVAKWISTNIPPPS